MASGFKPGDIIERIVVSNPRGLKVGEYDTVIPTPEGCTSCFVFTEKYPYKGAGNDTRFVRVVNHVKKVTQYVPTQEFKITAGDSTISLARNYDTTVTLFVENSDTYINVILTQKQVEELLSNLKKVCATHGALE